MNWLLSVLDHWADMQKIEEGLSGSASFLRVDGLIAPVKFLIAARLAHTLKRTLLIISASAESAERTVEAIRAFQETPGASDEMEPEVMLTPSLEALLYEDVSPDPRLVGERLAALGKLLRGERVVLVANGPAVFQRSVPPHVLRPNYLSFVVGKEIDREAFLQHALLLGYEREQMVDTPGQISVRGGLLDLYPSGALWPVRVELFGDEIDSIRTFDPTTQHSLEAIECVRLLPARELLLTEEATARAIPQIEQSLALQKERLAASAADTTASRLEARISDVIEAMHQRTYLPGMEYFLPFLHPEQTCLLDYLPPDAIVIMDEPERVFEHYEEFMNDLQQLEARQVEQGFLMPLPDPLHLSKTTAQEALKRYRLLELRSLAATPGKEKVHHVSVKCQSMMMFTGDLKGLTQEIWRSQQQGDHILIATRQADRLIEILDEAGIGGMERERTDTKPRHGQIVISERSLNEGFRLPDVRLAIITDHEIFGWQKLRRPIRPRRTQGTPISFLTDLQEGDYVVHINHGVGIYRGLVRRGPEDSEREYLMIEYAGNDRLYVPTDQFDRVQKYLGGEEERPQIHRLGGVEWERTKRRARRSARELAGQLVRLYSLRQSQPGHAFLPDTPWQAEMEDGFIYDETPDQLTAIEEVKQDMEVPRPMDRLVCGDVGYGKTEVAIRAAFKAVMDGKQVAVLVPTTVLAQQHYVTFKERLSPYPIRIEMMSRFRTPKQQARVVSDLAAGAVEIVIGTHRLLSKDIQFRDLGLVIIDEEQRFGVRHKEKLKQLRTIVDVITLTATPIPRTLHMALSGIRDMSVINDPPPGRMAIVTRALERDDAIIREAILRELERGGQVYVVHNRVESIGHIAEHIQRLVPHARIAIAHGQIEERELESAMLDFYAGEAQVLICTTIIENGLDIPNANTMMIYDADRLGLAQLYQLRGRVGRSNRQAYVYLMWTPMKRLTEAAEKRIAAIREFSELGSGFKIALRDLEIRGAGNMLGPEQHGFVAAVGFELYMQMLAEAVEEAKHALIEPESDAVPPVRLQVTLDIPVSAYLPQDYAPDINQRIELYRRLAGAPEEERLKELEGEITDRFGRILPQPVKNLIRLAGLKIRCAEAGIKTVTTEGNLVLLRLAEGRLITPELGKRLYRSLRPQTRIWLAEVSLDRLIISIRTADTESIFVRLEEIVEQLKTLPLEQEARRQMRYNELMVK